jgi:hypothetical protein
LLQAVASTAVSTLCGAAIGAGVGSIVGRADLGFKVGEWVGLVLGLVLFPYAVAVPFGFRDFVAWCLASALYLQTCLAVPIAASLFMIARGVHPVLAIPLALFVVHPTFVVILMILFPTQRLSPRVVTGPVLGNFAKLEKEAKRRLAKGSASQIWHKALGRHMARWKPR